MDNFEYNDNTDSDSDLGYGSLKRKKTNNGPWSETICGITFTDPWQVGNCSSSVKPNKKQIGHEVPNLVKKLRKVASGKNTTMNVSRHEADEGFAELAEPCDFFPLKMSKPNLKIKARIYLPFTRLKTPTKPAWCMNEAQTENTKIDETEVVHHSGSTTLVTSANKYAAADEGQKPVDRKTVSHHETPPEILKNEAIIHPTKEETKQKATNAAEKLPTTATFDNGQQSSSQFTEIPELMTSVIDVFSCKMLIRGYRKCLVVVVGFISGVCFLVYWALGKEVVMPGEEMLDADDGIDKSAENLDTSQTLVSYRTQLSNGYHRYSFDVKE